MNNIPDNTDKKQAKGKFKEGVSGNPSGRPKGSRNKATIAIQSLLDGEAEEIARKAIELAKDGDMTAIRLVLERIIPPRKDAPIEFAMPEVITAQDIPKAINIIMQSVADGSITITEANGVTSLLDSYRKSIELEDLEQRIIKLEDRK